MAAAKSHLELISIISFILIISILTAKAYSPSEEDECSTESTSSCNDKSGGIILATGFMHVLPDSYEMLQSICLKEDPWHNFPFSGYVAMLSAIATLMGWTPWPPAYTAGDVELE
ncbi:hypothetical protein TB2_035647 [Malus domestica]